VRGLSLDSGTAAPIMARETEILAGQSPN